MLALSTAFRVRVWPAPSVVIVTGAGQVRMPLPPSSQMKLTVTSVLFHPAAFGAGVRVALIVGGIVSSPRLGVIVADPPPFVPTMVSVCIPSGPRSKPATDQMPPATAAG